MRIACVSHCVSDPIACVETFIWAAHAYFGMSSESKESKVWECPECGKAYLRQESLAAHIKSHKSADKNNYITREQFAEFLNALKMGQQGTAYYVPASAGSAATTSATPQGGPPPLRLGHFVVREKNDGTADIICPNCGAAELDRPLPVKVEEKVEREEVEVVPPGYIPAPKGGEDWLRVLSLKHADGKGPEDCPECAKALKTWFDQNRAKLERASRVAR